MGITLHPKPRTEVAVNSNETLNPKTQKLKMFDSPYRTQPRPLKHIPSAALGFRLQGSGWGTLEGLGDQDSLAFVIITPKRDPEP